MHFYSPNITAYLKGETEHCAKAVCTSSIINPQQEMDCQEKTEERCKGDISPKAGVVCELRSGNGASLKSAEVGWNRVVRSMVARHQPGRKPLFKSPPRMIRG